MEVIGTGHRLTPRALISSVTVPTTLRLLNYKLDLKTGRKDL